MFVGLFDFEMSKIVHGHVLGQIYILDTYWLIWMSGLMIWLRLHTICSMKSATIGFSWVLMIWGVRIWVYS